jgi:hypothetical protein
LQRGDLSFLFNRYYEDNQVKEDEMGRECGMILFGNPQGKSHWT